MPLHALAPEERPGATGLPHDGGVDLRPGLDHLVGIDLDVAPDLGVGPDQAALADDRARLAAGPPAQVARTPEHGALDPHRRADVGVPADDRVAHLGPLGDAGVGADGRVGPEHRVLVDGAVLPDEGRTPEPGRGVDRRPLAEPHAGLQLEARDVHLDLAVEDVLVGLEVGRRGADVLPVAVGHVAEDRPARLEHGREDLGREVDGAALGDEIEDLGLEDVDTGVDGVAEDLAPARLLQEALDAPVLTGDDDAELERVLHRAQGQRGQGVVLLVELQHGGEVDVGQHVARNHQEALRELVAGVAHRTGRAERRLLGGVDHAHAELGAVAEVAADGIGQEGDGDHDVGDAVAPQQRDDVLHHRPADQRQHRLGQVRRLRSQACPFTARHDHRLHAAASGFMRAPRGSCRALCGVGGGGRRRRRAARPSARHHGRAPHSRPPPPRPGSGR